MSKQSPTPKQIHTLWKHCALNGTVNTDWIIEAKQGKITKQSASEIIGKIFDKDYTAARALIKNHVPDFEYKPGHPRDWTDPAPPTATTKKKKEPAPEPIGEPIPNLDEILQRMNGVIAPDMMEKLRKGIEDERATATAKLEEEKKKAEAALKKAKASRLKTYKPVTPDYVKPDIYDEVMTMVKNGEQVFLNGPAGCGKSRMFEEIAKELKREFFTLSLSGGVRYPQVFGGKDLHDGTSEWTPAPALQTIPKPNTLFFIDEVLSGDEDVLIGWNSILERNTRSIMTPIGRIEKHKDCFIVAAANTTGRHFSNMYTGTKRQDESILQRFVQVQMSYDPAAEEKILSAMNITGEELNFFMEKVRMLRESVKENAIPYDPGTRQLIAAGRLFHMGFKKERAYEIALLNPLSEAERNRIDQ